MSEEPIGQQPVIRRKPKRRGGGLSIRQLLYAILLFALLFGLLRLFKNHLDILFALAFGVGISFLVGFSFSLIRRRASFQEAFLALVETSHQTNLPLSLALRSFAPQCGYFYGQRLIRLAARLDAGIPLSDAVATTPGVLPLEQRVYFRVADFTGAEPGSLERIVRARTARMNAIRPLVDSLLYYMFVVWQISVILLFLSYSVAPKLQAIFADFGVALPGATSYFISMANGSSQTFFASPVLAMLVAISYRFSPFLLLMAILYVSFMFQSGRGLGLIGIFIPWITTGERAGILRGMGESIRAGKPIDECLETFAEWSMRRIVRRRCRLAAQAMTSGVDWVDALVGERIIKSSEVALIRSSVDAGRAAWAFEQLADAIENRQWYRYRLVSEIMGPIMTVFVASLVFFAGVAFFEPLVNLIQALAS